MSDRTPQHVAVTVTIPLDVAASLAAYCDRYGVRRSQAVATLIRDGIRVAEEHVAETSGDKAPFTGGLR